jgi:uncharacterized membrane protein YdjX (TVP38/TMEM64 family)
MSGRQRKIALVGVALFALGLAAWFDLASVLSFENLKASQSELSDFYAEHSVAMVLGYFVLYVAFAALSIPGTAVLTLGGGAVFGFGMGLLITSFASSIGATLAFLMSRYLLRDWLEARFGERLTLIQQGVERDGAFYVFSLRLIPLFPFFVVNLVLGLTRIRILTFYIVSQVGMLAGTAVYVNAGTQLASLESPAGILSPVLLGSFALLGVFPVVVKWVMSWVGRRRAQASLET